MISIVIPLYNKENSIAQTINCLKCQTMQDFEAVIIDDGSIDASYTNALKAIDTDKRFRVIHQSNKGVSSARNRGVKCAKYEYISFLDADDIWENTYLEEVLKMIQSYPHAGIYGIGWNFMYNYERKKIIDDVYRYQVINRNWESGISFFTSTTTTTTKSVLNHVGMFNENVSIGEDVDMWCRILLKYTGVFYNKPLAYYVQDSENRLYQKHVPIERNWVNYMDQYKEERINNTLFRSYIDKLMAAELIKYLDSPEYKVNDNLRSRVKYLKNELDFQVLPFLTRMRLRMPWLFRLKKRLFT